MNALIFLLLLMLSAPANSQSREQAGKWNTIGEMCGQLVYSREARVKGEENSFQDKTRPAKNVELRLYRGTANQRCCGNLPLADRTTTNRKGLFRFKSLAPGGYWVEATANGRLYNLAVNYSPQRSAPGQCKDLLFELEDSGKFQLARIVTVD